MVDHFNYDSKSADEKHDVLLLPTAEFARKDIKNYFSVDGLVALPRAVGQLLGNASPHLSPVLRASETAYTYNPKEDADGAEEPFATGKQISLVTAFQAVNSARFTILGSSEALEDAWFDASVQLASYKSDSKTSNRAFAQKLSAWTFKEAGVLRAGPVTHFLNEGAQKNAANSSTGTLAGVDVNPGIYRIKNDVYYSIEMSEWVGDHWEPKDEKGPSDAQAARDTSSGSAEGRRDTAGGVDANASKQHLYDLAKDAGIPGRSSMDKGELVEALDKANRQATARARED